MDRLEDALADSNRAIALSGSEVRWELFLLRHAIRSRLRDDTGAEADLKRARSMTDQPDYFQRYLTALGLDKA